MKYHIHITKKAKEDMVQAADYIEFLEFNSFVLYNPI